MWAPFGKKVCFAGIVDVGGASLSDPFVQREALANHWIGTLEQFVTPCQAAVDTLLPFSAKPELASPAASRPPPRSAPTPSAAAGPPRHRWAFLLNRARWRPTRPPHLAPLRLVACRGFSYLGGKFTEVLQVFTTQGHLAAYLEFGARRELGDTRPDGLKHADSKTVVGASHARQKHLLHSRISDVQCGCVHGRNFLNNIDFLDSAARAYSTPREPQLPPTFLGDFGAAFPSAIQAWLFLTQAASKAAPAFVHIIKGIMHLLYTVTGNPAGVLFPHLPQCGPIMSTGCLLLLSRLRAHTALHEAPHRGPIPRHASSFCRWRWARPPPLVRPPHALMIRNWQLALVAVFRLRLAANIPAWYAIPVAAQGKYLGTDLCLAAGGFVWSSALRKMTSRSTRARCGAPFISSIHMSNLHVHSVSTYLAQLSLLPAEAIQLERHFFARVLHIPPFAADCKEMLALRFAGSQGFRLLVAVSLAALIRSAIETAVCWPGALQLLRAAACA